MPNIWPESPILFLSKSTRPSIRTRVEEREVQLLLQVSESSDRLKRERWMDQKAKKIKDQTVRSLEGEVQKIMSRSGEKSVLM